MKVKYYLTNLNQLPIAIISSIIIIAFCELLFSRITFVLIFGIVCFIIYCLDYLFDLANYNAFKKQIEM